MYNRYYGRFDRVTPFTNLWRVPSVDGNYCTGSGAWELAARWSFVDFDGTSDGESGEQHNVTLGINWYLNPYVRLMCNYIFTTTEYGNGDPDADNDILAMRVQWDF